MAHSICRGSPFFLLLLLVVPKYSRVDMAGAVHDYLYRYRYEVNEKVLTRRDIDMIWLKLAVSGTHKASMLQAIPCWFIGLRVFAVCAWISYKGHRMNNPVKS